MTVWEGSRGGEAQDGGPVRGQRVMQGIRSGWEAEESNRCFKASVLVLDLVINEKVTKEGL